jgi:hypothetical protein
MNDEECKHRSKQRVVGLYEVAAPDHIGMIAQERGPSLAPRSSLKPSDVFLDCRLPTRIPSLSNSPRIRSAPHVLFSAAIARISATVSAGTLRSTPAEWLLRLQILRNPSRCHRRTVSGRTMATTRCHPGGTAPHRMSLSLSSDISLARGTLRRSTTSWCRSKASCRTSSRRGLTASRAMPTATPSGNGGKLCPHPRLNTRKACGQPCAPAQTSAYSSSCHRLRQVERPRTSPWMVEGANTGACSECDRFPRATANN